MPYERPPTRFLRVLLVTFLILAAIVALVPEHPEPLPADVPVAGALAAHEGLTAGH
jgi:hypothetical protein